MTSVKNTCYYSAGQCQCGAVSIAIDMKPFLSYNCHCSHCRGFASRCSRSKTDTNTSTTSSSAPKQGPVLYHGGGFLWKWNVHLIRGQENIEYESSSALFGLVAMKRGRCKMCRQAIWESGERFILPLAMVMAAPLLPEIRPDTDIFYNSGYQQGPTGTRILRTDIGSLAYEIFLIVVQAIPMIPWSLYKRLARPKKTGSMIA